MNNSFRFVKGHCGWDTVTLVVGEEVPEGKEVETALKILDPPINGGIEVGFMYRPRAQGDIRLRIVDSMRRTWLPMCGGRRGGRRRGGEEGGARRGTGALIWIGSFRSNSCST